MEKSSSEPATRGERRSRKPGSREASTSGPPYCVRTDDRKLATRRYVRAHQVVGYTAATPPTVAAPVFHKSCGEAKAAGAAPLHRGDPGYSSAFDRDGDGVACG